MYSSSNSQKNRRLGYVGVRRNTYRLGGVSSSIRAQNARFAAQAGAAVRAAYAPAVAYVPSRSYKKAKTLDQQVKALIAAKKREAADVTRATASQSATTLAVLTSTTDFATAASGTGLLDFDGDECLINHVRIKGILSNPAVLDLDAVGSTAVWVRMLVVWFYKPLLIASAAGTIPPITEVLITDAIASMPVTDAANGGRFRILADRKYCLGDNTYQAATAVGHARVTGRSVQFCDFTVKINKKTRFAAPAASGSTAGGHYDSDVAAGRVDRGLLVMYTQVASSSPQFPTVSLVTRLNYTG